MNENFMPADKKLDQIDRKILSLMQKDSTLSIATIAETVGISQTPCWRRIHQLEEAGFIARRVALLNPTRIGLKLTAFVIVRTSHHSAEWLANFSEATRSIPEIVEIHRMSGEMDYLLKIITEDIEGYDRIYKKLISKVTLSDVSAAFSMESIKYTTELPL